MLHHRLSVTHDLGERGAAGGPGTSSRGSDDRTMRDALTEHAVIGRSEAVASLIDAIGDGRSPHPRLIRLAGESGIGKSTVVAAVRPALRERGIHVIGGKYENVERASPYGAFAQAFSVMLRWILAQDDETVARWRARITQALAPNTQVLLDLMPGYERLLGPQPPLPTLDLSETRIRTGLVARRFTAALAAETPLVIELDDLQWADPASLALLETLSGDGEIANLTILAAYRDNEVDAHHPATLVFARVGSERPLAPTIELRGLNVAQVGQLLREALEEAGDEPTSWDDLTQLARIVHRKTQGNPLFVRQFLATLRRKGLVRIDDERGQLAFDGRHIASERFTDNVVDLVIDRIRALPASGREVVEIAACCIARIDRDTLKAVSGRDAEAVDAGLALTLEADILRGGRHSGDEISDTGAQTETARDGREGFAFQHDKVREGAYRLLTAERRGMLHAALARRVMQEGRTDGRERMLLADHIIAGRDHLDDDLLARAGALLVAAAETARRVNAYGAALNYLDTAFEIGLSPDPRLAFEAGLMRVETLYLLGDTDAARGGADTLLESAPDDTARVAVLQLKVTVATAVLAYREALETGQKALELLGEPLDIDPSRPGLLAALARTRLVLGKRGPDTLLDLPRMSDPAKLAAMRVLNAMASPAYFVSQTLLPAIALRMVALSVRHGNAPESAYGYTLYGIIQTALLGHPRRGLAFGELGLRAIEPLGAQKLEGSVAMVHAGFLLHWTAPLAETLPLYLEGAERAIATGDLNNHGYLRYGHASYAFMAGVPLGRIDGFLRTHLDAVTTHPHEKTKRLFTMARASVARMRGEVAPAFDEAEHLTLWREEADATSLAYYHKYRMLEALMAGDHEAVLREAHAITHNLHGIFSMAYQPFYQFYEALALMELSLEPPATTLAARMKRVRAARICRRLSRWSQRGTPGLSHRVSLLRAELAAARGATRQALRLFDRAATEAHAARALHDIGLIHERMALFEERLGAPNAAARSFDEAIEAYRKWGAEGWAQALARRAGLPFASAQGDLDGDRREPGQKPRPAGGRASDLFAARHDADEIVEDLAALLLARSRASRVSVLRAGEAGMGVVAFAGSHASTAPHLSLPGDRTHERFEHGAAPEMVVNYVLRTRERVTLDRASMEEPFASDPYLQAREGITLMCVPLAAQDEVLGAVCLEWDDGPHADTLEGGDIASVAVQAAIALQNARLVEQLNASLDRQVDLTSAHARFVPHAFLEMIGRPSIEKVRLGDYRQRSASILFSDIRGFTSRLETLAPQDALAFVNGYLSLMEPFVQENGGFIDSYIGDAVMAVFDRGPEAAVRTAGAMQRALHKWRGVEAVPLSESLRIGIGIASGELIFATLGAANRMKVGVVGDIVNLAARTEGLTSTYGCPMLVTRATLEGLPPDLERWSRPAGRTHVKGREAPVSLHEMFHVDTDAERERKRETRPALERFAALQEDGRPEDARVALAAMAVQFPDDPLIRVLMKGRA